MQVENNNGIEKSCTYYEDVHENILHVGIHASVKLHSWIY